ncbi:MAG: GMC family oxidoreductase [Myxococcota bacterium]
MIHGIERVRGGFDADADVIVVGSGPGGAVAADNLAQAGMRVALVEAGPEVRPDDMTDTPPRVLARYYWEGGLRLVGGDAPNPSMQGRCLGGSSVVNSAIMLKLPDWVRDEWSREDNLGDFFYGLRGAGFDRAFERVFARTRTQPTPMTVMGRRNAVVRDALAKAGLDGKPLPRAVEGCKGCADCITGCHSGAKQSVDRAYLPELLARGGEVFTCSQVDRILVERGRATGVSGRVIDIDGWRDVGRFTVRAPRIVVAAGVAQTPALLLRSGLSGGGRVGKSLYAHLSGLATGIMEEPVEPWSGATQGWGAFSKDIRGLKYEALWAPPSLIGLNWGGIGRDFLESLRDMRFGAVIAVVYKARVTGSVKVGLGGAPRMKLKIPTHECHMVARGLKTAVDGLLDSGARYVATTISGMPARMRSRADSEALLSQAIRPHDCHMTFNHAFGSCRMSSDPARGPIDSRGALRGVEGVWLADASVFPGPSAVNPQATIMAMADVISRGIADVAT